jgi:hypothetical protein
MENPNRQEPKRPIRDRMQEMARAVDDHLPNGYCFIVMAFPVGKGGRLEYASNADREDVLKVMKEFIKYNESGENFNKHTS